MFYLRFLFISNIDGEQIELLKKTINPETTLFIISSKSFKTIETTANADVIKSWLLKSGCDDISKHFVAVTSNFKTAKDFGIGKENIFRTWNWVGGRFSLWSAAGLPIALAIGFENFEKMLLGAYKLDEHFDKQSFYGQFGEGTTFPQVVIDSTNLGGCVETVQYLKEKKLV